MGGTAHDAARAREALADALADARREHTPSARCAGVCDEFSRFIHTYYLKRLT